MSDFKGENIEKLIVIDNMTNVVSIYDYDSNIWEEPEDFTDSDGNYVIHSNCVYSVIPDLIIKVH